MAITENPGRDPESSVFTGDPAALVAEFLENMREAEDDIVAYRRKLSNDLHAHEEQLKKRINDSIYQLELKNIQLTEDQRKSLAAKYIEDEQKERIKAELDVIKITSEAGKKQRELESRRLQSELNLVKAQEKLNAAKKAGDKQKQKEAKEEIKQAKKSKRPTKDEREELGLTTKGGIKEGFKSSFKELSDQLEKGTAVQETAAKNTQTALKSVGRAITAGLNAINNSITAYAKHQTAINTRLQGVSSYGKIVDTLDAVAFSPLLNAEELYNNVADLVGQGIVTNIEQRATFATLKDSIATTFDVTSDSLKRMIRLQREDSTAARLGMEAYLTEFLNVYVENTEYLQSTFDTVASSLLEASAMLKYNTGAVDKSVEFEYQVQKWLGALTGVGLSDEAAQNIAAAIGQLGSGDVDSLSGNSLNNLLLMGANKAGTVSYSDILNRGLDATSVNDLLYGMVGYMQEIASTGTNVVKNQLAKTFGISVSDLIAVSNLTPNDMNKLRGESLSYSQMYGELGQQFDQIASRMGISNIMDNLFSNMQYQTGANIAKNPASFALWKITNLIQNATGGQGIAIPFISAFGNGFDFNADVTNLMQMGIAGVSLLSNIGGIMGGLGSLGKGSSLLSKLNVNMNNSKLKEVGSGLELLGQKRKSGDDISQTRMVTNNDGQSYQDAAINDATDDAQRQLDQKLTEYEDPVVKYLEETVKFAEKMELIVQGVSATTSISPKGDTSIIAGNSQNAQGGTVGVDGSDINNPLNQLTGAYVGTDEFRADFKSIVDSISRMLDFPADQKWNGTAADGSNAAIGSNFAGGYNTGGSSSIDGFTQYGGGFKNTLSI